MWRVQIFPIPLMLNEAFYSVQLLKDYVRIPFWCASLVTVLWLVSNRFQCYGLRLSSHKERERETVYYNRQKERDMYIITDKKRDGSKKTPNTHLLLTGTARDCTWTSMGTTPSLSQRIWPLKLIFFFFARPFCVGHCSRTRGSLQLLKVALDFSRIPLLATPSFKACQTLAEWEDFWFSPDFQKKTLVFKWMAC